MIISRLNCDNITFLNLHAEQSFEGAFGSFLDKDIQQAGIFQNALSKSTIDNIVNEISERPILTDSICFDFNGIELLQVNQDISFVEQIINKLSEKNILFTNIRKEIAISLGYSDFVKTETEIQNITIKNNNISIPLLSTKQAFESVFHDTLKSKYLDDKVKFHKSSPVYINKFIDLKKFITYDQKLFIYSLYFLSILMTEQKETRDWYIKKGEKEIVLFSQNMNSSYISSILSHYLQLDVTLIDHVGPINKLYSSFDKRIDRNKKYLVVADVVCLGTEAKISKNIIEFSGAEYIGNVSIVRINTPKFK
jgi:hypothetical protein